MANIADPGYWATDVATLADVVNQPADPAGREAGARTSSGAVSTSGDRLTLTVEEAAASLGISRASAYEAVRRGEIPAIRIGRRILVPRGRAGTVSGLRIARGRRTGRRISTTTERFAGLSIAPGSDWKAIKQSWLLPSGVSRISAFTVGLLQLDVAAQAIHSLSPSAPSLRWRIPSWRRSFDSTVQPPMPPPALHR